MKYEAKSETNNQWLVQEEERVYKSRAEGKFARKRTQVVKSTLDSC